MQRCSVGLKKGREISNYACQDGWKPRWDLWRGVMIGWWESEIRAQDKGELARWNGEIVSSANER